MKYKIISQYSGPTRSRGGIDQDCWVDDYGLWTGGARTIIRAIPIKPELDPMDDFEDEFGDMYWLIKASVIGDVVVNSNLKPNIIAIFMKLGGATLKAGSFNVLHNFGIIDQVSDQDFKTWGEQTALKIRKWIGKAEVDLWRASKL